MARIYNPAHRGDWCIGLTRRSPKPQREVRLLGPPLSSTSGGSSNIRSRMRSDADKATVRDLLARGYSDRLVADISGVSANTVGRWRRSWPPIPLRWRPPHEQSYAYLLGMYLGDGCLYAGRGRVRLQVSLDSSYPAVIDDCWTAMVLCMPDAPGRAGPAQRRARYRRAELAASCGSSRFRSTGEGRSVALLDELGCMKG